MAPAMRSFWLIPIALASACTINTPAEEDIEQVDDAALNNEFEQAGTIYSLDTPTTPGSYNVALQTSEGLRTYRLHVPANYVAKQIPTSLASSLEEVV